MLQEDFKTVPEYVKNRKSQNFKKTNSNLFDFGKVLPLYCQLLRVNYWRQNLGNLTYLTYFKDLYSYDVDSACWGNGN